MAHIVFFCYNQSYMMPPPKYVVAHEFSTLLNYPWALWYALEIVRGEGGFHRRRNEEGGVDELQDLGRGGKMRVEMCVGVKLCWGKVARRTKVP